MRRTKDIFEWDHTWVEFFSGKAICFTGVVVRPGEHFGVIESKQDGLATIHLQVKDDETAEVDSVYQLSQMDLEIREGFRFRLATKAEIAGMHFHGNIENDDRIVWVPGDRALS